jgi:hypothetical protein
VWDLQHFNSHELHRTSATACAAAATAELLGKVQVNQHATKAIGLEVSDDDVVLGDISM